MMDEKSNLKDELAPEIKQEPESLEMTPLTSFKSLMRQALGYDELTPIDLTKHISVALRSSSGSNAIAEREADSDILRFFAAGEYPAVSLKVSIVPVQEGTGDPSPENIRAITGWTTVKVYQAAEYDEDEEPVLEVALGDDAGTVYGGVLDVITGVLTVGAVSATVNPANIAQSVSIYYVGTNSLPMKVGNGLPGICDRFPTAATSDHFGVRFGANNSIIYFYKLENLGIGTIEEARAWFTANPTTVVYPLATPLTYQLDPEELSTLAGENNIWADCGPVESITY